jgi:sugar transferase (PEP-CTERM/EpsH1 system associated)
MTVTNAVTGLEQSLAGRRVLVIMGRVPWPLDDGWKMRSGNLLKGLLDLGARIDLVSFGDPTSPAPDELRSRLARVELVPRRKSYAATDLLLGLVGGTPFSVLNYRDDALRDRVGELARGGSYDMLLVEDVVMAQYAAAVDAKIKFLDMHNVESHLLQRYAADEPNIARSWYASLTAAKLARYEREIAGRFTEIFVCSDEDRRRLNTQQSTTAIRVVPNGIDPSYFSARQVQEDGSIVFVGSMDYHANISGALHFANEILPRIHARLPDVRTYIVGKNPSREVRRLASENVIVTGAVPDVRPYLAAAGVSVVPLLVGGGTRLKILESMAMGKAIVSSTVGAEGIAVEDGDTIMLADDPDSFAQRVVELLEAPDRAREMGRRARAFVLERYAWSAIVRTIDSAYHDAMRSGSVRERGAALQS